MCFIFGEDLHGTLALSNPVGFFVNKICLKQTKIGQCISSFSPEDKGQKKKEAFPGPSMDWQKTPTWHLRTVDGCQVVAISWQFVT